MNLHLGKLGEKIATEYLLKNNFKIIKNHFTCRWGEIDIIAKKGDILYFIEVKTRTNLKFGQPEEAVSFLKLKSLKKAINYYLMSKKIDTKMKLAVIAITLDFNLTPIKIKFYNIDDFS